MKKQQIIYVTWGTALMVLIVRYFWTSLFGFGINAILLDGVAFLLVTTLSLITFIKKDRDKRVLIAFAPLIIIALIPMFFVIATLIAWSARGFAP